VARAYGVGRVLNFVFIDKDGKSGAARRAGPASAF
jgi:hypothetical protein